MNYEYPRQKRTIYFLNHIYAIYVNFLSKDFISALIVFYIFFQQGGTTSLSFIDTLFLYRWRGSCGD